MPGAEPLDIQAFRRLLRSFEQLTSFQAGLCCLTVTVPQCHALMEIESLGTTSIGGLAERLGLDSSTTSRTVDTLVSLGLVAREPDPKDRRYVVVSLTGEGRRLCATINETNNAFYQKVLESIPEERRAEVVEAIQLFVQATAAQVAFAEAPQ